MYELKNYFLFELSNEINPKTIESNSQFEFFQIKQIKCNFFVSCVEQCNTDEKF